MRSFATTPVASWARSAAELGFMVRLRAEYTRSPVGLAYNSVSTCTSATGYVNVVPLHVRHPHDELRVGVGALEHLAQLVLVVRASSGISVELSIAVTSGVLSRICSTMLASIMRRRAGSLESAMATTL
jgi:hypothetical protein